MALLGFLVAGSARAQQPVDGESLEAAATRITDQLAAAWTAGDADAIGELFLDDADFRVWNGIFAEGKEAIVENHRQILGTF